MLTNDIEFYIIVKVGARRWRAKHRVCNH